MKLNNFNIIRFYRHLKQDWHILVCIALVITLIMAVVAFNSPDRYRSEVLVAPSAQSNSSGLSGLASQLGGVASLAGVNLGGGGSDKTIEALETLKSKDFLIDFIENAFKHGVENLREHAFVRIHLEAHNNIVNFEIENNFEASEENHEAGIGLKNLKRRLEIVYPKKHNFTVSKTDTIYNAKLNITL